MLGSLLDMTPRRLWQGLMRRVVPGNYREPAPSWVVVAAGPLKGANLFLATAATDTWANMAAGTADNALFAALQRARPVEGAVIWDIGAHFGYHSLVFAALTGPTGRVVLFEPTAENLVRLRLHLERNPDLASRIQVRESAVGERGGEAEFLAGSHTESGQSSGSHLAGVDTPNAAESYRAFERRRVRVESVDELIAAGSAPAPDVLKIDVEGAEGAVLSGAARLLEERRPTLLIEVHHILQMLDISERLRALGYRLEVLDRGAATPSRCFIMAQAGR